MSLFCYEGQTPGEDVHKVRQPIWVRGAVKLPDVHDIAFILKYSSFVVVNIEVVWGGEDSHDRRESSCLRFAIHAVAEHIRMISLWQIRTGRA